MGAVRRPFFCGNDSAGTMMRTNGDINFEAFRQSLKQSAPPPDTGPLLQALWHEARGDWKRAHAITQDIDGRQAARLHAYLHRKEGDLSNAAYWYRRAGARMHEGALDSEWEALVRDLLELA